MRNKRGLYTVLVEAVGKYLICLCFVCSHIYVHMYVCICSQYCIFTLYICMYVCRRLAENSEPTKDFDEKHTKVQEELTRKGMYACNSRNSVCV